MRALGRKLGFAIGRGEAPGEFELTLDMSQLPPAIKNRPMASKPMRF